MGKRVEKSTTKEYVINAPLPQQTLTYTVISHGSVINKTMACLAKHGFEVEAELYRATQNANIAQGVYHLQHSGDPEMGLMFAWSNSYDKSMRFRCSIGARVYVSGSKIIPGNMGHWGRIHTGTADQDTDKQIEEQISNAGFHFSQLVNDKESMKNLTLNMRMAGELLGILFVEKKAISSEQLNLIKAELYNPTFNYSTPKDSLWTFYNHIILSLQKSHPKTWMDQQRLVHWFICDEFGIDATKGIIPAVKEEAADVEHNPNQITIYDVPGVETEAEG